MIQWLASAAIDGDALQPCSMFPIDVDDLILSLMQEQQLPTQL